MPRTDQLKRLTGFLVGLSLIASLAGCGDDEAGRGNSRTEVIEKLGKDVVLAGYVQLVEDTQTLASQAAVFCETPDASGLEATRDAWKVARMTWRGQEVFRFGPHVAFPERLGINLDFGPVREDVVETALEENDGFSEQTMPSLGAAARGFPALEYLLFGPGSDLNEFQSGSVRCDYLTAAAEDTNTLAEELLDAWSPDGSNYLKELIGPYDNNEDFMDQAMALAEFVNRIAFTIENIRADELEKVRGPDDGSNPLPNSAESRYARFDREDIRAALMMIRRIYYGASEAEPDGLDDLLVERGRADVNERFDVEFEEALDSLDALPAAVADVALNDPAPISQLSFALRDIQAVMQADVAGVLSLSLSFNDNDGD